MPSEAGRRNDGVVQTGGRHPSGIGGVAKAVDASQGGGDPVTGTRGVAEDCRGWIGRGEAVCGWRTKVRGITVGKSLTVTEKDPVTEAVRGSDSWGHGSVFGSTQVGSIAEGVDVAVGGDEPVSVPA